jgi:hypothetical protein
MKYSAATSTRSNALIIATLHRVTRSGRHSLSALALVSTAALSLALTGCVLGTVNYVVPAANPTSSLHLTGVVHGGQQPVVGSAIKLWAVGNAGYGSAASNLIGLYSNGSACSYAPDTITGYVIAGGVVTFTGTNKLQAGQTFSVSGLTSTSGIALDGQTFVATVTTGTTFSASTTVAATATTTDSGTAIPQCPGATSVGNEILSDGTGSFSITGDYTCPSPTTQVYITATGGNPGLAAGTNNKAIVLAAPLGQCGNLNASTSVFLNEVTTAATAYALGQYFTPTFGTSSTDSFGAPNTTQAQLGLSNAVATIGNLVGVSTGAAVASSTLTGAGSSITAVPESAKLNTVANILASCVNSLGASDPNGNCTSLFAAVTPTGGTAPTDVLQAAVDLSLNPTSTNATDSATNISTLFNLQTATTPFIGLAAAPTDWTLGIQYQDNVGTFFLKPQNIAVDGVGNVWVLSNNGGSGSLVQLSPVGVPTANIASLSEYGPFTNTTSNPPALSSPKTTTTTINTVNTVFTTTFGAAANNPSMNPRNLAIDPSNNVWFTQSSGVSSTTGGSNGATTIAISGNVFEIAADATTGLPTGATYGFATGKSAYGLAIDATGNVFIGEQSSSAYFGFYEFPYNATPGNALLTPVGFPPATPTTILPEYIAIDKTGNKLFTSGSATATAAYQLAGATASSCPLTANTLCQPTGSSYTPLTSGTGPYGLAEGTTGTWLANSGTTANTLSLVPFGGTTSNAFGDADHFLQPKFVAVDGLGNVWTANSVGPNSTTATTGGSVSALTAAGAYLSPSNGGSATIAPGFTHLGLNFGSSIAVDPSGNVWIANNAAFSAACSIPLVTPTSALTSGGNTCSSVFEMVGAAAPVVTPLAAQTATGPTRP